MNDRIKQTENQFKIRQQKDVNNYKILLNIGVYSKTEVTTKYKTSRK